MGGINLRKNILIIAIMVSSVFFLAGSVTAVSAVVAQDNIQEDPDISGDIAVWRKTTYPGTTHWSMDDPVTSEVYFKNLKTGSKGKVSTSTVRQWSPKVSGTRVIWQEGTANGHVFIYVKNLATGAKGVVTRTSDLGGIDISDNRIVWKQNKNGRDYIYVKNIATGVQGVLATGNLVDDLSISGDRVAWCDFKDSGSYIYVKNIATRITGRLGTGEVSNPDISGTKVVWQQYDSKTEKWVVYVKNLATGASGRVTSSGGTPKISGNRVVWEIQQGSYVVLYAKNLATNTVVKVNQQWGGQFGFSPVISGDRVVWQDWKPYLFAVFVKNVVTGAKGRVQY